MAARFRRRRYMIARAFQLKFAGMILVFMFCVTLFTAFTIYYNVWVLLGGKLANVYPQGRLVAILKSANISLFYRMFFLSPLVFILAIVLSHRIAGPIYRMKRDLDEIAAGNYSKRLRLRKTDELKDVAESINNLIDILEEKKKL